MIFYRADRLVTCDPAREGVGVIEGGCVGVENGAIAFVGTELPNGAAVLQSAPLITPGLVDAHTHLPWAGSRHAEYAVRMAGGDYVAIAKAGGGIAATQRAVAAATQDELEALATERLRVMASLGVTTVEAKSGYGLLPEHELKQLRAIAAAGARSDLPRVVGTFLALHALPSEYAEKRVSYIELMVALVAEAKAHVRFVDAYIDPHAFTVAEARMLGEAARAAGLGVRLHVGQFGDVGGAELAAELGARSADHLEHVGAAGIERMAAANVFAGLLPIASFTLRQEPPPIAAMRERGVRFVVASDANPGTAPTLSLPLAMALAVRNYGLSIEEVILGATRNAAESLDLGVGVLRVGAPADVVLWNLPHEAALAQPWGASCVRTVLRDGAALYDRA